MDAVTFYCGGDKHCINLSLALYSLREFYSGKCVVWMGQTSIRHFDMKELRQYADVRITPDSADDYGRHRHWCQRWRTLSMMDGEFDRILHLDADVLFMRDISFCFDLLHEDPETFTTFNKIGRQNGPKDWLGIQNNTKHLAEFQTLTPGWTHPDSMHIEFCMVGWRDGWPHLAEVADTVEKLTNDQLAVSWVVMNNGDKVHLAEGANEIFRLRRAHYRETKEISDGMAVWHITQGYKLWWDWFFKARENKILGLHEDDRVWRSSKRLHDRMIYGVYPTLETTGKG